MVESFHWKLIIYLKLLKLSTVLCREFAASNAVFVPEFVAVFTKMLENKAESLSQLT